MLDLIVCPEPTCGGAAEIIERLVLESTDGPVEHVRTYCVRRHIFLLPTQRVSTPPSRTRGVPDPRRGPTLR